MTAYVAALPGSLACVLAALAVVGAVGWVWEWSVRRRARALLAEAERNAARYKFLRAMTVLDWSLTRPSPGTAYGKPCVWSLTTRGCSFGGRQLDAAIDAAIARATGETP